MGFNDHSNLRGLHAFLSPSNYHWLNYDKQKMRARWSSRQAARRGTRIHDWAHEAIKLGMRQKENSSTVNKYINDGIRYRMIPEFIVFFSIHLFGEADTLSYREESHEAGRIMVLRISDLKTGLIKAGITQLEVYAAIFCLEYDIDPEDILIILRIYQNDQIYGGTADAKLIRDRMNRIVEASAEVDELDKEAE